MTQDKITLYVRKQDRELWERARALAGGEASLSALVADALKEYVEREERRREAEQQIEEEMQDYELEIYGPGQASYTLKFRGTLLAADENYVGGPEIYITKAGKFVLYDYDRLEGWASYWLFDSLNDLVAWVEEGRAKEDRYFERITDVLLAEAAERLGKDLVIEID